MLRWRLNGPYVDGILAYGGVSLAPWGVVYLGWQTEHTVPSGRGQTNKTRSNNTRRLPVVLEVATRHQKAKLQPSTGQTDKKQSYNYGPRLQVGQKLIWNTLWRTQVGVLRTHHSGDGMTFTLPVVTQGRGWTLFYVPRSWMCLYCNQTFPNDVAPHTLLQETLARRWGNSMTTVAKKLCQMTHWSGRPSWKWNERQHFPN